MGNERVFKLNDTTVNGGLGNMSTVVFNADDFGLSRGVNYGILDCHLHGVVSSTTMLVNMPGTRHAVALAQQHPSLRVGVHLALTIGTPLAENVPSLTNQDGQFRSLLEQRNERLIDPADVLREWTKQIETFFEFGLTPSHLDSHHHMHNWAHLRPVIEELASVYQLPWRHYFEETPHQTQMYTEAFDERFYKQGVTHKALDRILDEHRGVQSLEIMCHPAYADTTLTTTSSYVSERLKETDVLMTYTLPDGWTLK